MKKLLRLFVMTQIKNNEDYYLNAMKSQGIDVCNLTHNEICLFKAQSKQIEADLLIEMAFEKEKTSKKDFDYKSLFGKN